MRFYLPEIIFIEKVLFLIRYVPFVGWIMRRLGIYYGIVPQHVQYGWSV
jgi:hypothetical protein